MKNIRCLLPIVLLLLLVVGKAGADATADRKALLEGVTAITAPGAIPGPLAVISDNAFVVMTARTGKAFVPMVAAANRGKGRIVAIGHEGFISQATKDKSNARFLENAIVWAGHGRPSPQTLRVGTFEPELISVLKNVDTDSVLLNADDYKDLGSRLINLDVLYLNQSTLDNYPDAIRAVREWVKRDGGGVILAGPAWGWKEVTGKDLATEQSANLICSDAGILWTDGMLEATGKEGEYTADSPDVETATVPIALERLKRHAAGQATLPERELTQATQIIAQAVGTLPASDKVVIPTVNALCEKYAAEIVPTHEKPITLAEPIARLKMVLEEQAEKRTPVEKIKANPASQSFPGAVPEASPRLQRDITIDLRQSGWLSTGLYAAPGEVITISIPPVRAGKGLAVRIGAHTDTLWHLEKWERWPDISRRRELTTGIVRVASPFGGAVYLEVPDSKETGTFTATIQNVVAAPLFVRGTTTLSQWQTVRNAPAPWAELVGHRCTLTVPSSVVRTLDNPEELMAYWDSVMETCDDFYAVPKEKRRPQRYCVDRQISAGYMHSGYPIMTWEDVAKTFVDISVLRGKDGQKTWGFYHELGHNHQESDWTWDGCGEVTNNLFSLYGGEVFNSVTKEYTNSHPAVRPAERDKRLQKYLKEGARYEQWKSDPFLALSFFIELREAFGWEPFTRVFKEYRTLSNSERPDTDEKKRNEFMVRLSKAVGKNLGPFFTGRGIPTSEQARQQIAALPLWMPETP